jgi:oligopeptide/dipeptide ABC transporter ATP-binding protein
VMYAGRIVESGKTSEVFASPRHPYTSALLKSTPREVTSKKELLPTIPGTVMAPHERGIGCSFAPRCERAISRCNSERPELDSDLHQVACWSAL